MDRDINPQELRRKYFRRGLFSLLLAAVAAAACLLGPGLLQTRLARKDLLIAPVTVGPLSASIFTTGMVEPEFEHVVSSPFNTRVLRVLRQPGSSLRVGEAFLELDTNQASLAIDKLNQQIQIKQIQQSQSLADLGNTLITLRSQKEIKQLEVELAGANATRMRQLFRDGLLSQVQLDQTLLDERKAAMEWSALEARIQQAQTSNREQIRGLETEMRMLRTELVEAQRQLTLATASAETDGVLTWVRQEEGATVPQGDVLGRIADLSAFRVRATVSDTHARTLHAGQPVVIRINEQRLAGQIRTVLPTVTNGSLAVLIGLDKPATPFLKPNLRVDVEVVTQQKARTLRVKRGPSIHPESDQEVYVIRGGKAKKTVVRFGVASTDECEILSGVGVGEELILTDLADYQHLQEIKIR